MTRAPGRFLLVPAALLTAAFALARPAADKPAPDPYDQSKVPLEVDSPDPSLAKIVLIAGKPSHPAGAHEFFAGTTVLVKCLKENPGVWPVMARDGWPKNENVFKGAKSVVFFMDGRQGHPLVHGDHMEVMQHLIDQKAGFVNLHYAVDYDQKPGERILGWLGGYYDAAISINPHWVAHFTKLPEHPIARGVHPFSINDEWYYNMRWVPEMKGVTPILTATPPDNTRKTADAAKHPGREEIVAWAFERPDGGRGFGFTGAHFHQNWANDDFRRLVVNAILWSAHVAVPPGGAKVDVTPEDLNSHLDRKGFGRPRVPAKGP